MCACICFLDTIGELHTMDDKMFNDFLIGHGKWVLYAIKAYLIQVLCSRFVLEAFITSN